MTLRGYENVLIPSCSGILIFPQSIFEQGMLCELKKKKKKIYGQLS